MKISEKDLLEFCDVLEEILGVSPNCTGNCDCKCDDAEEDIQIKDVIFNEPATIIKWTDGTKTVVKCQNGEPYDREKGFAMAIVKKICGNTGCYNDLFHKWCDVEEPETVVDADKSASIEEVIE